MCPFSPLPPSIAIVNVLKAQGGLGNPRCRAEQASKLKWKKWTTLIDFSPFWILSICYGSAASTPTSSARISVLVELKVVNGRSHSHLSQIAVTVKHNHVSPLVFRPGCFCRARGAKCKVVWPRVQPSWCKHRRKRRVHKLCKTRVGVRVQFVPRVLCEVCRVIHPSYELRSEARLSPTVNRLSYKPMREVSMPFARMPR